MCILEQLPVKKTYETTKEQALLIKQILEEVKFLHTYFENADIAKMNEFFLSRNITGHYRNSKHCLLANYFKQKFGDIPISIEGDIILSFPNMTYQINTPANVDRVVYCFDGFKLHHSLYGYE